MKDVMIDIETLGVRSTAAIVQIGACYFDRNTGEIGETFEVNISHDGNRGGGFSISFETITWWMKQSEEARNAVFNQPACTIEEAMELLQEFLSKGQFLWAHATFDLPIIQNAFEVTGWKNPIPFRGMRDIRTLIDLSGYKTKLERDGVHHTALDDAKFQVAYCFEALKLLKT